MAEQKPEGSIEFCTSGMEKTDGGLIKEVSDKPLKSPPPRYKMFLVTWLGVEIMTILIRIFISPVFSSRL